MGSKKWRVWCVIGTTLLFGVGAGVTYRASNGGPAVDPFNTTAAAADHPSQVAAPGVSVEVAYPRPGGIERVCIQPGSVEPYEAADLYAKASGFLVEQSVDIGSRVKAGDVLARIAVPEYEKQVQRDSARVKDADAKVKQMEAHLAAARSEAKAAEAAVTLAKVLVRAKSSYRQYREKQLTRFKELARERALEARVVDEQEDFYLSALEAENAAKEGINTAVERAATARAKIDQAAADLDEARAGVEVAAAELERTQVLLGYTVIKSPYTGVVTRRSFHLGDFVKSADQGGVTPVLSVERTDVMRVVVRVPDRDVPYVSLGDPAVIEIDALPGLVFETKGPNKVGVARWADAEDPQSRTMRTEVDVPNPDGKLRHGMYGRVALTLSEGTPNAVRVPSAALSGKAEGGRGTVRVVRDGKARVIPVRYATDNGIEAEIISGLTPADRVIVRANGPLDDGTVVASGGAATSTGH
ncbi:MAG: efflux RND transporter periplasmic adaptor subunit [Gemmataceae bacterium]